MTELELRRALRERDYWRNQYRRVANIRWDDTAECDVCATCGVPVEAEPCPDHDPQEALRRLRGQIAAEKETALGDAKRAASDVDATRALSRMATASGLYIALRHVDRALGDPAT